MGLLEKLSRLFSSGGDARAHWVYVRCDACGEVIATRIDLHNDLSATYEGGDRAYYVRKQLVGTRRRCYRPIEVELTFDRNRRVTSQEAEGGTFVDREAFLAQEEGEGEGEGEEHVG